MVRLLAVFIASLLTMTAQAEANAPAVSAQTRPSSADGPVAIVRLEGSDMIGDKAAKPAVKINEAIGHVTVSRASHALGRPVYAWRQDFSGSDRLVAFSTRPPSPKLLSIPASAALTLPNRLPLNASTMTSNFGYRRHPLLGGTRLHSGIDLAAPVGAPVFATSNGTVSAAGWRGGYGLLVVLEHANALETRYAHLSRLNVTAGQVVRSGDIVGFVGSTGRSTGPHLHYEVRAHGRALDPLHGGH